MKIAKIILILLIYQILIFSESLQEIIQAQERAFIITELMTE